MNEKQDVIELSKEYSIVTPFTSFVAIEKRDKVRQLISVRRGGERLGEREREARVCEIVVGVCVGWGCVWGVCVWGVGVCLGWGCVWGGVCMCVDAGEGEGQSEICNTLLN